jgi:hypothetical protein
MAYDRWCIAVKQLGLGEKYMRGNGRTANLAIFGVILASTVIFSDTAAARSGSAGFGHARYSGPSGVGRNASAAHSSAVATAPRYRESGRNTPDGQASRPAAAEPHRASYSPASAGEPSRQSVLHANSPRGNTWGDETPQARGDYRQRHAEYRHTPIPTQQANYGSAAAESPQPGRDYRPISAQTRYPVNPGVVLAGAPMPVQPVYAASAPVAGYGTSAGNSLLPFAGLLGDAVAAIAEYMRSDEQYEANQGYDRGD